MRFDGSYPSEGSPRMNAVAFDERIGAGENDEDGMARKKVRKTFGAEQHVCVTCGRTDSPEWRKGPLGPKTLCNACGLRWAKRVKTNPRKDGEV